MTNQKKRKTLIDRDDIRSDYCCSFVRGVGNDDDTNVTSQKEATELEIDLNGRQAKEFYESLFEEPLIVPSSTITSSSKGTNVSSGLSNRTTNSTFLSNEEPSLVDSDDDFKAKDDISSSCSSSKHRSRHVPNRFISNKHTSTRLKSYNTSYREKLYNISASKELPSTTSLSPQMLISSSRPIKIEDSDSDDVTETEPMFDPHTKWRLTTNLLTYASQGNKKGIKKILATIENNSEYLEILDGTDSFGWTPLMCACAENHLSVVKYLLKKGCSVRHVENTGKSIFDICQQKESTVVLEYLENHIQHETKRTIVNNRVIEKEVDEESNVLVICDICGDEYRKSEEKSHLSSTVHLFNDPSKEVGSSYSIPDHNKGFQMMLRSGWNLHEGLGPEGSGRKNPIKTKLKQDRLGLGVENNTKKKERVSHFSAFDRNAVKRNAGERVEKKTSKRTYERKRVKEKAWEQNMRRYMSSDY